MCVYIYIYIYIYMYLFKNACAPRTLLWGVGCQISFCRSGSGLCGGLRQSGVRRYPLSLECKEVPLVL